ncbi:MAG: hypothetical protein ABI923_05210, partial [bacterium]
MLGDDAAGRTDEGVGPEGRRLREFHDDRVLVDLFDHECEKPIWSYHEFPPLRHRGVTGQVIEEQRHIVREVGVRG